MAGGRFRDEDEDDGRRRTGSVQWQKDIRGRKYRDREGERYYQNQNDRDEALQENYKPLNCDCCSSLLAYVSRHSNELVAEYARFCSLNQVKKLVDSDTLGQFELERFGERAHKAAHQVLLFRVRENVWGDPYRKQPEQAGIEQGG